MIALEPGVDLYVNGRKYTGSIPAELCPDHLKPAPVAEQPVEPARKPRKSEFTDERTESLG